MDKLKDVPTKRLFAVVATLESAHESEQLERATWWLGEWGVSQEEATTELLRRESEARKVMADLMNSGGCDQ